MIRVPQDLSLLKTVIIKEMGAGRGQTKRARSQRSRLEDMRENNEHDSATVIMTSGNNPVVQEDLVIEFEEYLSEHLSYENAQDLGSDDTNLRTSITLWVPKGGYVDASDIVYDVVLEFVRAYASEITSCEVSGRFCTPSSSPSKPNNTRTARLDVNQVSF
jgi:hypothetical protein